MIDLHCHSTFSDGVLSPEALVHKAIGNQVQLLSLTDHDTYAGYDDIKKACQNTNITLIPGIELSVRWRKHEIHMLGYQFQIDENMSQLVSFQNESRIARAKLIGERLEAIGIEKAYQKACELAGHARAGRLHFAKILLEEGRVRDLQSAFRQFLGRGKGAYIPSPWIQLEDAAAQLKKSNGQAVIAHPLKYGLTRTKLHELMAEFKSFGGAGVEVVSGEITNYQANELAGLATRFGLLASSGSDFHSDKGSVIQLGRQMLLPKGCTPIWHDWTLRQGVV